MSNEYSDYSKRKKRTTHRRTVRNITVLVLLVMLLIGFNVFRIFALPRMQIEKMDYIEIARENGEPYQITITSENCGYEAGGILKWSPVEGVLVMKNGETYPALYDGSYDVFMLPDEYSGCYKIVR